MNIILFGFKGCGKTHFGKLIAKKLRRRFIDTDDRIIDQYEAKHRQKLSCREIYIQLEEAGFRALEREAVLSLRGVKDSIIAVGGGAVLDPQNLETLQSLGKMVYLKASFEVLSQRILGDVKPSYIDEDDPLRSWKGVYRKRRPIYESIPATRIDTDLLDEPGVVAALYALSVSEK